MTNEQYLVVSYFAAAAAGVVASVLTALVLYKPLRGAVEMLLAPAGRLLRRLLPMWLILAVLFAFMSVSYLDCGHHSYREVVEDRPHLVNTTHSQARTMAAYLGVGLVSYCLALAIALIVCPAGRDGTNTNEPDHPPGSR